MLEMKILKVYQIRMFEYFFELSSLIKVLSNVQPFQRKNF